MADRNVSPKSDSANPGQLLAELVRVQAIFQLRAIAAVMGVPVERINSEKGEG